MARTLTEIRDEIYAAKAADALLNPLLTSTSNAAVWRLWVNIFAGAIYTLEVLFDLFKAEVELLAARSEYGSIAWNAQKALEFQYGDTLTIVNGVPTYAVVDESMRIVKRASVSDGPTGGLIVKVAKELGDSFEPLSGAEETAFTYYFNKVKFAGIYTSIINLPADLLKGTINIYHDGLRDLVELEADLNAAVAAFIKAIDFDGTLHVIKLVDALQSVDGVTDVDITSLLSKEPGDIYIAIVRYKDPKSGYFQLDTGAGGITWTLTAE
jgi:hypothetical protein